MTDTTEREALLTDEERAAIQARLDAATPGPWHRSGAGRHVYGPTPGQELAVAHAPADGLLIAHAPTDLAALLVENQRLRDTIQAADRLALRLKDFDCDVDDVPQGVYQPDDYERGQNDAGRALAEALGVSGE